MIHKIVITTSDNAKNTQEGEFLLALTKLVGKEEINFTTTTLLGKDITKNEEMQEIVEKLVEHYKKKMPSVVTFKKGKVTTEGKIILTWEYENKNKD